MRVDVEVPAAGVFAATTASRGFRTKGRRRRPVCQAPDVRALLRGLEQLGFHTPGGSTVLSTQATDAVVAFQKAYGLPRTYVFDDDDWWRLATARRIWSRSWSLKLHIEIDKRLRDILMVVKRGQVVHILPTSSTGATGRCPRQAEDPLEGAVHDHVARARPCSDDDVQGQPVRDPWVRAGAALPASHGCARIPLWWRTGLTGSRRSARSSTCRTT